MRTLLAGLACLLAVSPAAGSDTVDANLELGLDRKSVV